MTLSITEGFQVLIRQWKVTSINGLSGSLIAVFSLAVLFEFLSSYHSYLNCPTANSNVTRNPERSKRLQEHLLRTVSYLLSFIAGYLLMLVVSTWNVLLFIAILTGIGFGYFLSNPLYTWYCTEFRNIERPSAEEKRLLKKQRGLNEKRGQWDGKGTTI